MRVAYADSIRQLSVMAQLRLIRDVPAICMVQSVRSLLTDVVDDPEYLSCAIKY